MLNVFALNVKMVEAHGTKFAQVRPLGKSFRYGDGFSDDKYKFSYFNSSQNKSSEFYTNCEKKPDTILKSFESQIFQ